MFPVVAPIPRINVTLQPDPREGITHSADEVDGIRTIVVVCTHNPSQPGGTDWLKVDDETKRSLRTWGP